MPGRPSWDAFPLGWRRTVLTGRTSKLRLPNGGGMHESGAGNPVRPRSPPSTVTTSVEATTVGRSLGRVERATHLRSPRIQCGHPLQSIKRVKPKRIEFSEQTGCVGLWGESPCALSWLVEQSVLLRLDFRLMRQLRHERVAGQHAYDRHALTRQHSLPAAVASLMLMSRIKCSL
jgi:hypothetical protein